ncbi:hypothetical protein [Nitratireductor luteus]|uniref:hypothetical protein n=1 Tax=Nitratireductor luteus TaxID=2976980 RepID=UPI00224035FA|nr:hypothetical protein [Nitratireductor luteus]
MDFSAELVRTILLFGGMPALGLLVFYGLLRGGWGSFKFEPISSAWAAVIALAFLGLVGLALVLTYLFFSAPTQVAGYSHSGELQNLISQLERDPNAPVVVKLNGTTEEKGALGQLYFDETNALTYTSMIEKMCSSKSECIKCDVEQQTQTIVSISKTGNIGPNCEVGGATVYCCA